MRRLLSGLMRVTYAADRDGVNPWSIFVAAVVVGPLMGGIAAEALQIIYAIRYQGVIAAILRENWSGPRDVIPAIPILYYVGFMPAVASAAIAGALSIAVTKGPLRLAVGFVSGTIGTMLAMGLFGLWVPSIFIPIIGGGAGFLTVGFVMLVSKARRWLRERRPDENCRGRDGHAGPISLENDRL